MQPFIEGLADIDRYGRNPESRPDAGRRSAGRVRYQYWKRIGEHYKLNLTIVNDQVNQTFRFMHLDKDGAIRMDCSSECAMAGLLALRDKFNLAFANDRITTATGLSPRRGRWNPNRYLAVAMQLPVPASSAVGQRGGGG